MEIYLEIIHENEQIDNSKDRKQLNKIVVAATVIGLHGREVVKEIESISNSIHNFLL